MEPYDIPFYDERKAALIEEITAAFDGVSRAGGVSMSEAKVIDDYGSDAERAAARLRDTDTYWQDVPDEQLALNWPLHFFDPIGFRYYVPAYITYHLRWVDDYIAKEADAPLKFNGNNDVSLEYHFSAAYKKGEIENYFLAKFEMFTPAQGRAIAHFLQLEAEREDAWKAEFARTKSQEEVDEEFEAWKADNARRDAEARAALSPEQLKDVEAREREGELYREQSDWPDNGYRYALEKYWGRFL